MLHCETDKAEGGYIKTPGALFIAENGIKKKQSMWGICVVIIRSWDKYIALPVFRRKRRACKKSKNGFCASFRCGDESENSLSLSEKVNIHSDRVKIHLILLKKVKIQV